MSDRVRKRRAERVKKRATLRAWVPDQLNNSPARASSRVLTNSCHGAHRRCRHLSAPLPQPGALLALRR